MYIYVLVCVVTTSECVIADPTIVVVNLMELAKYIGRCLSQSRNYTE